MVISEFFIFKSISVKPLAILSSHTSKGVGSAITGNTADVTLKDEVVSQIRFKS